MSLYDSHCHLSLAEFEPDLDQVLARARASGLTDILIPGVDRASWEKAKTLQHQVESPRLHRAIGYHPWFIPDELLNPDGLSMAMAEIARELESGGWCAVGEIGLDKPLEIPMEAQQAVMEAQLQLAQQFQLPVILHVRGAHEPMLASLKRFQPPVGGVVHAFTGSEPLAQRYIDLGLSLGVGGAITYERAKKTRSTYQKLPLEHLLLETDAPSMPLSGHQGERNEPSYLLDIATTLAGLRNSDPAQVIKKCTENARFLFDRYE